MYTMNNQYIVVKDRHPTISEIKNDCVTSCWSTSGEPLSVILNRICGRISAQSFIFSNSDTINFSSSGTTISANVNISEDANNCITKGEDGGLYVECSTVTPGTTILQEGENTTLLGDGSSDDPYIISVPQTWWNLEGNSSTDPNVNFIGTTDLQPIVIKVNNIQAGFITAMPGATSQSSGSVTLGQFAGQTLAFNNGANTLIGHGAGAKLIYNPSKGNQNTFVGLWSGYWTKYHSDSSGGRNVFIVQSTGFKNYNGSSLTYVGTFAGELNNQGNSNTGIGRDALRSNIDGSYNVAVGGLASLYNTTGIKTITVTNGGSGYTTATVTISAPPGPTPGALWATATATATINSGVITGITVTSPGAGYSILYGENDIHSTITVTITGDGVGATASVTETDSATGNTSLGFGAGYLNRFGKYNIEIGYLSTLRTNDDYNILLGYLAGPGTSAPSTLSNAIAIGKNAKVSANNTMALGGTGVDAINVGINTEIARKKLDVVDSDILVHEITIGRGPGSVITNTVLGNAALSLNTTSFGNTVIGYEASKNVASSPANTVVGYRAFNGSTYTGGANIAIGYEAMYTDHPAESIAIGVRAMYTKGSNGSVAVGNYALYSNVRSGFSAYEWNTAIGDHSFYNFGGASIEGVNTGIGAYSGYGITAGIYNTALGALAMGKGWSGVGTAGSSGTRNVAVGHAALYFQNNSSGNIAVGFNTFNNGAFAPTIGYNIGIGYYAGAQMTTGNYNVILGGTQAASYATLSNYMVFADGQGNERFHINNTGDMILHTIQEHADNAAAVTAGLVVGTIYRTGDNLKIVH